MTPYPREANRAKMRQKNQIRNWTFGEFCANARALARQRYATHLHLNVQEKQHLTSIPGARGLVLTLSSSTVTRLCFCKTNATSNQHAYKRRAVEIRALKQAINLLDADQRPGGKWNVFIFISWRLRGEFGFNAFYWQDTPECTANKGLPSTRRYFPLRLFTRASLVRTARTLWMRNVHVACPPWANSTELELLLFIRTTGRWDDIVINKKPHCKNNSLT